MSATPSSDTPTKSPISLLSQDIFDIIFDLVRRIDCPRKRTLLACRNVSRAWSRITMKHYFRRLSLIFRLEGESSIVTFFVQDFVEDEIFDTVKPFVRDLTLSSGINASGPITAELLKHVARFPVLRHLTLVGSLSTRIPRDIFSRPNSTPSITSLAIVKGRNSKPQLVSTLGDLLYLCRGVRCLHFGRLEMPRSWEDVVWDEWEGIPGITSLVLRDMTTPGFLRTLAQSTAIFADLQRLVLLAASNMRAGTYVASAGAQLQHLEYVASEWYPDHDDDTGAYRLSSTRPIN